MFTKLLILCVGVVMMTAIDSPGWSKDTDYTSRGFGLSIATDKAIYRPGEPITITLTVFNYTEDSLTFIFTSTQRYDFFIKRKGKEIWCWSDRRAFALVMGDERIGSGRSLVYTEIYRPKEKLMPGIYIVTGMLTCRDPLKTVEGTVCIQVSEEETNVNAR